jgi:ubiquinone/menaquinone biosynthesis C-methylase UbiE
VRNGLPFASNAVDSVYSTHMLEHFYSDELQLLLWNCQRVLKPGGGIRLIVPNLASAISAYGQHYVNWSEASFPRHFDSLGGWFSNFVFCDGQHRTAFDFTHMDEVLAKPAFAKSRNRRKERRLYGSQVPPYEPRDSSNLLHSLYVEAFK